MSRRLGRASRLVVPVLGTIALAAVVVAILALRSSGQRSDRIADLEERLAGIDDELDAAADEERRLSSALADVEGRAAAAESRWLAAVAVSRDQSPADSRLLAVEAVTRHPTAEAMAALGTLVLADPRVEPPVTILEHGGPVWATDASSGLLVTGSDDRAARLWSADGTLITTLDHDAEVRTVAVASAEDGPVVVTGSDDGVARAWTADGDAVARADHDDEVNAVVVDAGGTLLVSAARDGRVKVTDIATGRLDQEFAHDDVVWSVALSADRARIATGGADGSARLWDLGTGEVVATHDLRQSVTTVSFSPDGRWLFAGGQNSGAHLFDGETGAPGPALDGSLGGGIVDIDWRADGSELTVVSLRSAVRFALPGGEVIGRLPLVGGSRGVAYGPDGTWLVTASGDFQFNFGALTFWETATGRPLAALNLGGPVESVSVQPGSGLVLAGFRTTADLVEVGGAWLVPGPSRWLELACAGTEGRISDQVWADLAADRSPQRGGCP